MSNSGNILAEYIAGEYPTASVAIVGNSPNLLEKGNGRLIDAYDCVIRINDGMVSGFEDSCGRRTDIRFIGAEIKDRHIDFFRNLREGSIVFSHKLNKSILDDLGYDRSETGRIVNYFADYQSLTAEALKTLSKFVDIPTLYQDPPRTGLVIISLLADMFSPPRRLALFGFDTSIPVDGREHYYDDGRIFANSLKTWRRYHCPIDVEFDIIHRLIEKNYIDMF